MNNNFEEDNTMKKTYETPSVEVVKFQYRDQVVVASGSKCEIEYKFTGPQGGACPLEDQKPVQVLN